MSASTAQVHMQNAEDILLNVPRVVQAPKGQGGGEAIASMQTISASKLLH